MAIVKTSVSYTFEDIRGKKRVRIVEQPDFAAAATVGGHMVAASKSDYAKHSNVLVNSNELFAPPAADSEVGDTARLYFELPDLSVGHFDIVDPEDTIFLATVGEGANIVIAYADLDGVTSSQIAVKALIDLALAGSVLISDGETPTRYLNGRRL